MLSIPIWVLMGLNRTFMELKRDAWLRYRPTGKVLIVPLWN